MWVRNQTSFTYFIFYFYRESQIELRQQIDLVAEGNIHTVICQNYSLTSNFPYIFQIKQQFLKILYWSQFMSDVNVCNCFSFKIVLVSPSNGQLCMVNSTQSSKLKHKDFLISYLTTALQMLHRIHISNYIVQSSLQENHRIMWGLLIGSGHAQSNGRGCMQKFTVFDTVIILHCWVAMVSI